MKDKKFPIVPVSIIGVAIVAGAVLSSTKPMVGSPEEIQEKRLHDEIMKNQQQAANTTVGAPREKVKADDLMSTIKHTVGNKGGAKPSAAPLITSNIAQTPQKAKPNMGATMNGWYTKKFGVTDKNGAN